ncbi:MAG: ATP-dependent sacrificial sulfur transferase LarE [Methanophagales archaeon ANME-1-THS]|nr:MAG: ATP-dependent sacrificial sulfur transferase LarE [Methanophagales archaeon ANME-1-THS]
MLNQTTKTKLEALRRKIGERANILIGFSGGVDSGVLLMVACEVLGKERILAVTLDSELLPRSELSHIEDFLKGLDLPHKIVRFPWQRDDAFVRNPHTRCYYCKRACAKLLKEIAATEGIATIAEGVTISDFDEYRPGIDASREEGIWHPLADVGITKQEVRQIAKELGLPFWDKPPSPCLATRIEYGVRITKKKLRMIEEAEEVLKAMGLKQLRVRLHHGGIARIEIDKAKMGVLSDSILLDAVCRTIKSLGFTYVTLDLEGYRRGSMDMRAS